MENTRLILVRHGNTDHQSRDEAFLDGWTDLCLSRLGEHQAEALRRRFADDREIAALYSSPLKRAQATARLLKPAHLESIRSHQGLSEIHCGECEGVPVSEIQERFPQLWERNFAHLDPDFRWPGGESYRELRARALDAVRSIAAAHRGDRVMLVTHCGFITQVVGFIRGTSAARWDIYRPDNGSVTEIRWTGDEGVVIAFNDVEHLADLPAAGSVETSRSKHNGKPR